MRRAAKFAFVSVAISLGLVVPKGEARAQGAEEDAQLPRKGLLLEGRLIQTIAPLGVGTSVATLAPAVLGGPPPIAIGYRGSFWSLSAGPSIARLAAERIATRCTGPLCVTSNEIDVLWLAGLNVVYEHILVRATNQPVEASILVGAVVAGASLTSSDSTSSNSDVQGYIQTPALGGHAAFGLRYWVSRQFGLSSELGLNYVNAPIGTASDSNGQTIPLRASALSSFGTMGISLLL